MYNREFQTSLLKSAARASSNYAKERQAKLDEEEEKRVIAEAQRAAEETAQKEADSTNPLKIAGDIAGTVGNFVKDSAVDLYETTKSAVTGVSDVVGGQFAADRLAESTETRKRIDKEHNERLQALVDLDNPEDARWDSKEVKEENAKFQASLDALDQIDKGAKGSIKKSQEVDTKKVAADTAETFLNVASGGTALGVKSAVKQAGKQVLKKQGVGSVAKAGVRGAAEGATFGGAAGLTDSISEDMNAEDAVGNIAQNAAFGSLLGGASAGIGKAFKNRKENKIIEAGNEEVKATQQAEAEAAATAETQAQLNEERPFNQITDEELDAQIAAFNEGGNRTENVQGDYQRQQQLLNEKQARQTDLEREAFLSNGMANDVEGAQAALDDFDSGVNRPDSVYTQAEPVDRAAAVLAREDIPQEIKDAAEEVVTDRNYVNNQLDQLMSPDTKAATIEQMDVAYDEAIQGLTQRFTRVNNSARTGGNTSVPTGDPSVPGQTIPETNPIADYTRDPRFIEEKRLLDEQYQEQMAELDMLEAQDAAQVEELQGVLNILDQRDLQITTDVNRMMEAAPDQFRDVDGPELQAQRQLLADNLEQAQRFNEPARIVEEVSNTPDPIATYNRSAEAQDAYKNEVSHEMDNIPQDTPDPTFNNLTGAKLATIRMMSPSQVLEHWGLRGKDIDLHTDILRAESALNAANKADSEVLTQIANTIPDNAMAQRQIIEYLEGDRRTLSAFDQESADLIRGFLDEKKAGLQEMGYATLDDYFPHVFDKNDPEVQRLFKGRQTGEIKFGNLKERKSDSMDYSKDIMNVLTQYASGYNRKAYLEPAIKPLADLPTQVKMADAESKWVDDYVKQLMGYDQSNLGNGWNDFYDGVLKKVGLESQTGKNHYATALGTQRMVSAVATMGLNPGTAIRNMTQMVNTVADIGPRYATIGAVDGLRALRAGKGSAEWAELQRAGIMEGGVSQNYFDAITKPGVRGRVKKGTDAAVKVMMGMIRATDVTLRAQAYYGAKALAASKGLTGKAAEDFAIRKTIDTQFITSRVDMPVAFNGQGVRSLTQLATFSGKQAGFLKRAGVSVIKKEDGSYGINPKAAGSVLAAVVTATLATEALKPVIGFRETEWVPFYDQIAPFFGVEGDSLYRSPLVRLLTGDGKSKIGLIEALQTGDFGKFAEDNWSQIVPAGTQAKKTTEGIATTQSGVSRNGSGNIRYLQDMDMDSQLKASLFGQYATESGRNWINQGFPTLSEKQTEKVDSQPSRELKQLYTDFYQAKKAIDYSVDTEDGKAKGRQAAYDEVKKAASAGDVNKAARIAGEYNAAVNKALAKFYKDYGTIPQELQDELTGDMYINATKVVDKYEEE